MRVLFTAFITAFALIIAAPAMAKEPVYQSFIGGVAIKLRSGGLFRRRRTRRRVF